MKRPWSAHVALAIVLLVGIALKARYSPPIDDYFDGPYYVQIARHVADGDGLQTSFSLFHQGLDPLPQPTVTYPLWPLALGLVGRVIGLERAAALLPELLYVLDLLLAAAVVTRVARRLVPTRLVEGELAGAFAAALLATNPMFFTFTSRPYTEGLAMALVLGALLAIDVGSTRGAETKSRDAFFAGAGLLAGLAYAARYQLLVAPFAAAIAIAMSASPSRRRDTVTFLAAAMVPIAWVVARLVRMPSFTLAMLVDHSAYRQGEALPPFRFQVEKSTVLGALVDRLLSVGVAFDPTTMHSYFAQFGPVAYAPIIAAVALLVLTAERAKVRTGLRSERWRIPLVALAVGIATTAPLHFLHGLRFREWAFGYRQGIFGLFVFWPALAWLVTRRSRGLRATGLVLAITGLAFGARETFALTSDAPSPVTLARREAGAWLDAEHRSTVTGMELQPLSMHTRAGVYWLACWSEPVIARTTIDRFHVTTVMLTPDEWRCPSLETVRGRLHERRRFGAHGELVAYDVE